jgi:hypothetical protein
MVIYVYIIFRTKRALLGSMHVSSKFVEDLYWCQVPLQLEKIARETCCGRCVDRMALANMVVEVNCIVILNQGQSL